MPDPAAAAPAETATTNTTTVAADTKCQAATAAAAGHDTAALPWLAIVALGLAAMATGMSMRLTDALLPRLAREFDVTIGQASLVVTVFAVAYGVSQLLFGPLGDRFGKYRVIGWSCAASAVSSLMAALAPGYGALLAARLAAGATAGAVIPLAMAWIGDVVPYERRQPVLARFLIGQITGFSGGVWLGGYTAEHLPWQAPFIGVAAFFALVAAVLWWVRRGLPAAAVAAVASAANGGHAVGNLLRAFRAVLALPWARVVLVTVFFEGLSLHGPFVFIATHLHQRLGLPLSTVAALVMGYAAGGLVFALGAQLLVHRLGEVQLVRVGSLLMAVALVALAAADSWGGALAACIVLGLGFYMMHNTLQTHATQMAPERRGAAVAAFAASFFLGQSAGVGLAGALVGRVGIGPLMIAGAAGLLAVAWGFNRARRRVLGRR